MKVRIYPVTQNSVEIDGTIFPSPESVDRFIKALDAAKKIVWPVQDKKK